MEATVGIAMRTILGHLAQFGSFSAQGEVLCTQGLAYLLREHPDARSGFAEEVTSATGVSIGNDLNWLSESYQKRDRGRPDLEARTAAGVTRVKVEAKLGADLGPNQLHSYAGDLQNQTSENALVVLVPRQRIQEAQRVVCEAFGFDGTGPWRPGAYANVAVAVVSWDDVLNALGRSGSERFHSELEQFEAMYRVLSGDYLAPFASPEELLDWRKRETDLINLVDQVTRRLTTHHRIYPMGVEQSELVAEGEEPARYTRRYVCRSLGETTSCFSIGVREPFTRSTSPVWLRFNKSTGHFDEIRRRLEAAEPGMRLVRDGGHLWMALDVPLKVEAEQMVGTLISQVEAITRVAYA